MKKQKDIVIKKNNKYFNTLTNKYVSEAYAKRLNSYFKRNPKKTLYQAGGHGKYERYTKTGREKSMMEQSQAVRKLAYSSKTQIIRTRTRQGKTIYYSPFQKKTLTPEEIKRFSKLDYFIAGKKAYVELFRLTRELNNIYHIITWDVGFNFTSPLLIDTWLITTQNTYNRIMGEYKTIASKLRFSSSTMIYGNITFYTIPKYEKPREFSYSWGFAFVRKSGFEIFEKEYYEIFDKIKDKLENDSYKDIALLKVNFYVYDSSRNASQKALSIASYRVGVNRIIYDNK